MLVAQTNLASCQNELNFAEHNKEGRATPMKNIAAGVQRPRNEPRTPPRPAPSHAAPKGTADGKPATNPPTKPRRNSAANMTAL